MHPIQAVMYARVSSEQQAEAHTIASQVAAVRERVAVDGLSVSEAMQFLDEGYRGATLVRPALERLRDVVASGSVDRLYVHSPDRLARKYAYQVLLVDEFRRAGVEVIFLNRALGQSPEDDLLLQVQGMIAEYERAKIIERHRRGKRHAARIGAVNVLSGAPYGYRYVTKYEGGGQARYEIIPDEARVVRQVFAWVSPDRLTIGEVCRRLTQAGELTRTGRTVWDRSVVWGILKNPAYQGTAAFGKTRLEPLRPRLRAQRNRPVQPRRAVSVSDVPPEDWLPIPVPALVEPEVFAAIEAQLQANKRHARQSRRGALSLLQGLLPCQHCGYAFYGKRLSPSARKGQLRAYAYYRCLGTDAYRFGGERICPNTQVRTDLLDLAVWQEVCSLLAHPERLAEEYRRRLQPGTRTKRTPLTTIEGQLSKLRQGVVRLIDSYAEGLIDQGEFEPRVTRLRQRLARLEEQRQVLADEAALQGELQLIIGHLEEFAAKLRDGLEAADWASKRDLIRTLVKRVEVARDDVNVVFRIDPYPSDTDPGKKVCNFVGGVASPLLAHIALHGLEEFIRSQFPARTRRNPAQPGRQLHWQPQRIRYADDLVILHRDRTVIEQCRRLTQAWLQDIGLELSEQKTRIAHTLEKIEGEAGFNFLGFQVRQYRASKYNTARGRGFKTLITPSQEAVKRHWATLAALISQHKAAKQANLIGILNPIIAGWANY